jgi:hypothetical protein
MTGLAGEEEVQELQQAFPALLHIGVVLDEVLTDVVGNAALVVGVPHITVKIQYDFLVGHGIDPPIMCWNDYTPRGGKNATEISDPRRGEGEKKVIQSGNSVTVLYLYNREEVLIL